MKTRILLILLFSFMNGFPQVDNALKRMQLYEGSVYVTYGHRITEVFSELDYKMGVGLFPKTNIAFLNYQQLVLLMQDTAKREQWSQEKYMEARNRLKQHAPGGRIILYVERFDMYQTNNKFFFIIIRGNDENKIFEYQLPYKAAELVTTDVFSNWAIIDVDVPLPECFFIYVNHKMTEHLSDTKFLVEQNAASLQKPAE